MWSWDLFYTHLHIGHSHWVWVCLNFLSNISFLSLSALLLIHKWCSWMISQWSINLSYEVSLSWECLASFSIWYYHPKRKSCLFVLLFPGGERGKFSELCKYYISWIHNTSMKKHHCFMCTPQKKKVQDKESNTVYSLGESNNIKNVLHMRATPLLYQ